MMNYVAVSLDLTGDGKFCNLISLIRLRVQPYIVCVGS